MLITKKLENPQKKNILQEELSTVDSFWCISIHFNIYLVPIFQM